MTNIKMIVEDLDKVTDPRNWRNEFKNQVLELLGGIAELYRIRRALETLISEVGREVGSFRDPELRSRLETVVAGGIMPENQVRTDKGRPLAPILWGIFSVELYPHHGEAVLNSDVKELLNYIKAFGIENVRISIRCGGLNDLFTQHSCLAEAVCALHDFLRIVGETSLDTSISTLIDGMCGSSSKSRLSILEARDIIVKYIPPSGGRADELVRLLNKVINGFWELSPGVNPYVTFALSMDAAIAQDLLNLVNGDLTRLRELIKILDYTAMEDRKDVGRIIYNVSSRSYKVDIAERVMDTLRSNPEYLHNVALYSIITERKYGRPEYFDLGLSWVHRFCCNSYNIGCVGYKYPLGIAYVIEGIVNGTNELMKTVTSYMESELQRILNEVTGGHKRVKALTPANKESATYVEVELLERSLLRELPVSKYNEYWEKLQSLRKTGALYSPALTIHPVYTPRKIYTESEVHLMTNVLLNYEDKESIEKLIK